MKQRDTQSAQASVAEQDTNDRVEQAEQHALTILETIPDGFIGLDSEWRLLYINAAAERMIGRLRADLLGKDFWKEFSQTLGTPLEREFRRTLAEQAGARFEEFFEPQDRYYEILATPCKDGISVYFRDTTEEKRLRETQEESEIWRRLVFENSREFALFSTDVQGNVTLWNPGAEEVFGYSEAEMKGKPIDLIYTPEDRAGGVPQQEQEGAASEGHAEDERWHLHRDGHRMFISGAVLPLYDSKGVLRGFTKVARNLTDRKRMEDELVTARDHLEITVAERTAQLQATISELETFSYSLSHDMRAPLRAMRSFSQILDQKYAGKLDPEGSDYLQRISSAAERLDRLIQDILVYGRLARSQIKPEKVELDRLVKQIIKEHPSLDPAQAEIKIDSPLLSVLGHEASLSQCLSNLLTNAVKFVAPGATPRVRIWTEPVGGQVRLWVQDNGIGIPKEEQEHVFGLFQRLHDQQTYDGTGIGLAIVRKAVERMGGTAGVESDLSRGSKFWLQLPRAN